MGKMKYKISSRATILLGRESVSKVDSAIIELVKNTYDADAELCYIFFDIDNDSIYILDNGVGMTKKIIENHWMMIGTDNKREEYKSSKSRIKSGEKGIGRFALDRLGSICEMFTKNEEEQLIIWKNDWSMFEQSGLTIDQIEADFEYDSRLFIEIIPKSILDNIEHILDSPNIKDLKTGTLLKISDLRDEWTSKSINNVLDSLGYLIPPSGQKDYIICVQENVSSPAFIIENKISEEYDYRIFAEFIDNKFKIHLNRNEFDINRMPKDLFEMEEFKSAPFTLEDFKQKSLYYEYEVSELMQTNNEEYINKVKELGKFKFDFTFMKLTIKETDKNNYFYKTISKNRNEWMRLHNGVKIYRDNFLVRPYGDPNSNSFDWLGIDAKKTGNPTSVSHPSGTWGVAHRQIQGTLHISRVENYNIIDKSSREGLIENEYFNILKDVIKKIISIFENDRAYIARYIKKYNDLVNEKEIAKIEGSKIAKEIIEDRKKSNKENNNPFQNKNLNIVVDEKDNNQRVEKLAKAVTYYKEEREELISENKLLRRLATNGLMTSSIVHDLKSIKATFINRIDSIEYLMENNEQDLLKRSLEDLRNSDEFLKAWITISTHQKNDKRKRPKQNLYEVVKSSVNLISSILKQKNISINVIDDGKGTFKKIYISDFESILYNLIINSVESFERNKVGSRNIDITLSTDNEFVIRYEDNGSGISTIFKNPYDIFKYGVTSKIDKDGTPIGTGLGMYIVESTLREYDAKYKITKSQSGFGIEISFSI